MNNAASPRYRSFLIIQTAFAGDTVLATAVVEKLAASLPEASIDILVRKGNEDLFKGHPYIRRLYVWDKGSDRYRQLPALLRNIRNSHYDCCINLQRHYTTALITLLSGAGETVGFSMNPLSCLFTRRFRYRLDPSAGLTHEIDLFLLLLTGIVPSTGRIMPRLYPSREDFLKVGIDGPFVTVAPASIWFTKQYPVHGWVEVIDLLDPQLTVCLIGGRGDRETCERIKAGCRKRRIENFAGELTLLQSAALMKNALMNYVNDSAPLHLASAMSAPVTAVFCSTTPDMGFGPLGENSRVVETKEKLPCRPCSFHGLKKCPQGHFRCAQISAGEVVGRMRRI